MSEESSRPQHKEGFMERWFHHHGHKEGQEQKPHDSGSHEGDKNEPEHEHEQEHEHGEDTMEPNQAKDPQHKSRMKRFKDYMHKEEDLDEAGETYAGLM